MSVIELIREAAARRLAMARYLDAHERFNELEQLLVSEGRIAEAEGAHEYALICIQAYENEHTDPEPPRWD